MSKTNSLHYKLCLEGAKWLIKQKYTHGGCKRKKCYQTGACGGCHKYKYVAVEICTWNNEHTDVWGLGSFNESVIIEVKTSRADFIADSRKWCRNEQAANIGRQAGTMRWFLCPEYLIKDNELPEKWGLLYYDGKKIYPVKAPIKFENTAAADIDILTSILRRERFPNKIFNYRGQPTTIKHKH